MRSGIFERLKISRSLSRTIIILVGLALIAMQVVALVADLYSEHGNIERAAEQRSDAALDMLASVHTQAMSNRQKLVETDAAIATLNGTMEQFSQSSKGVELWVAMGPKVIDFQKARRDSEMEPARDEVDREAIVSGDRQIAVVGGKLRQTRPVIMGQGAATINACGSCHMAKMGIQAGEVMGAYSAAVDLAPENAAFWVKVKENAGAAALVTLLTLGLIALLLRLTTLRPLERLTQTTHDLAQGELEVEIVDAVRVDEIGDMARSLEVFRNSLLEKRKLEDENAYMARHDALTGLPNRATFNRLFDAEIEAVRGSETKLAVVGIDLDRFKEINDRYGHAMGDEVLITVAQRASDCLIGEEILARIGGDEFSAVKRFEDISDLDDFLMRLRSALTQPVVSGNYSFTLGASLGVSIFPEDGCDREVLVSNADLAMYRAKGDNGVNTCYYEARMDERARQRSLMVSDLRRALAEDQFTLYYQPQNDTVSGEVVAYEALLRWEHPEQGFIPPDEFVSVAEEFGLIDEIGDWVLKNACEAAAGWADHLRVAVNISAVQLAQNNLPHRIHELLVETGLPARQLELEITETAIIADRAVALHKLRMIKALGVAIAIDDFGSGYSSLAMLNSFPFDKIKIDRSFLSEAETRPKSVALIRAIIAIGQSLDVPVLAEGVETEKQLALLKSEGCSEVQGYFFGKPQPERALGIAPRTTIAETSSRPEGRPKAKLSSPERKAA